MPARGFYAYPRLNELLQGGDTREEASLLERLHAAHGNGGTSWLEPACGTGRLVAELSRRGWSVLGYDREPRMLAWARRASRGLPSARVLRGDLRRFRRAKSFDVAYCLQGTFRHLLTARDARAHLDATAASLRDGGLYILGLDLADYLAQEADEETWEARDGRSRVTQVQMALPPDRRRRRERLLQFLARGRRLLRFAYELRTYDEREFRALVARSPFELAAVYDPWGRPSRLDASTRAATFVLRVNSGRATRRDTRGPAGPEGPGRPHPRGRITPLTTSPSRASVSRSWNVPLTSHRPSGLVVPMK